jgi:hypothetical protein
MNPANKLKYLLRAKTFDQLLSAGYILDARRAAALTGFTRQHIYRLVRSGDLPHVTRGVTPKEVVLFFLREDLLALFNNGTRPRSRRLTK